MVNKWCELIGECLATAWLASFDMRLFVRQNVLKMEASNVLVHGRVLQKATALGVLGVCLAWLALVGCWHSLPSIRTTSPLRRCTLQGFTQRF